MVYHRGEAPTSGAAWAAGYAEQFLKSNGLDWGPPRRVVSHDGVFWFYYDEPEPRDPCGPRVLTWSVDQPAARPDQAAVNAVERR